MCFLGGKTWGFISQKTAFFIVTAVKTSNAENLSVIAGVGTFSERDSARQN
jgi:hypothetical protein